MISVNQRAAAVVGRILDDAEALGVRVLRLSNGATVLDAGVRAEGSLEAGRRIACACLADLASVCFTEQSMGSYAVPAVAVDAAHPALSCLGAQYAGWAVARGGYFAMGSGPARALAASEEIYGKIGYADQSDTAVLLLETRSLPDEGTAEFIAGQCRVRAERLFLLAAPTSSLAGSVQIAARSAETGMHKLLELGFDVRRVVSARGICPLAPPAGDDLAATGRTNDAILYGSKVWLAVRARDEELADLAPKVPSESSPDHGVRFGELFERCGRDFYRMDRLLFSPAVVTLTNLNSGRSFSAGHLDPALLRASFYEG